jgi:mannose/fructose/N-acetylgalactosamine-specific phosphotransferase system component IIB
MAIIQIKRRTSAGTGPLIGSTGTIKAGEPLVDLNGGNLYISKQDKTGTAGNPLATTDYIEYLNKANAESSMDTKITALALGTASKKNTGTTNGTVPLIGADGKLPSSIIPDVSPVTSVNAKTGAVTITLSELGGVSTTTYNAHVSSNLHLTDDQRTRIANVKNVSVSASTAMVFTDTKVNFLAKTITSGLVLFKEINTTYTPNKEIFFIGLDKDVVLTHASIIDGGTY